MTSWPAQPTSPAIVAEAPSSLPPPAQSLGQRAVSDTLRRPGARIGLTWLALLALAGAFAPFVANSHPIAMKVNGIWSSPMLRHLTFADVVVAFIALEAAVLLLIRGMAATQRFAILAWSLAALLALTIPGGVQGIVRMDMNAAAKAFLFAGMTVFVLAALATLILVPWRLSMSARGKVIALAPAVAMALVLLIFPPRPPQTIVFERYRELERQGQVQAIYRTLIPFSANDRLRDQPEKRLTGPSAVHWLGTESSGADLLSRMIHASRIALAVGFISQGIAVLIGVVVGGIMGYYVGKIDILGMRLIEIFEATPRLFLLIAFTAFFGRNLYLMMAIIGLTGWTGDARFIRGEFFKLRNQDFVLAAVAGGLPTRAILFRHLLPNGIAPVLVSSTFGVAGAILLESTLSFLGLGLIDEPSWGEMLNQARAGGVGFFWWIAIFPGLAIFLTVFAYVLIGEAVRDALDPKLLKR